MPGNNGQVATLPTLTLNRSTSIAIELPMMVKDRRQIARRVKRHFLETADDGEIIPPLEFIHEGFGDLDLLHLQRVFDANHPSFPGLESVPQW